MVARGDLREMELFRQFHVQASAVQRESINWLQTAVPSVFEPNRVDYIHCLRKVIIEPVRFYFERTLNQQFFFSGFVYGKRGSLLQQRWLAP